MQFFEIKRYPFSLIVDGICGSLIVGDDAYSVIEIFGIIILCGQDEFPRHIHAPVFAVFFDNGNAVGIEFRHFFKKGFEQPLSICGLFVVRFVTACKTIPISPFAVCAFWGMPVYGRHTKEKADTCYLLTMRGQQEMGVVRIHGISILLVDII